MLVAAPTGGRATGSGCSGGEDLPAVEGLRRAEVVGHF